MRTKEPTFGSRGADGFKVYANTYPGSGAMVTIPESVIGVTTDSAWWPRVEDLF